jgi:intein/homing endonuclease
MCWIGLLFEKVESVSGTNKAWSKILKLITRIELATRLNHDKHKLNKVIETKICGSKRYRTMEDMNFFLDFSADLGMKTVNKLKGTQVYLTGNPKSDTT